MTRPPALGYKRCVKLSLDLPNVPDIGVRRVDVSPEPPPFLSVERVWLVARFPDGSESTRFGYDSVTRRALDAVVIVAWQRVHGQPAVYLRTAVRPPLQDRATHPAAADTDSAVCLWELPAGLIEVADLQADSDRSAGIRRAASRELEEELGFRVPAERFSPLGGGVFPSPAMTAERQFFAQVEIGEDVRNTPSLDGSPLEEHAVIALVPLDRALTLCEEGLIVDSKTELALRRLAARFAGES